MSAKNELEKLLIADEQHGKMLENDELTTVRRNLQTQGVDVPYEIVSTAGVVKSLKSGLILKILKILKNIKNSH